MGLSEEENRIFNTLVEEIKTPERATVSDIATRKIVLNVIFMLLSIALIIFSVSIKQTFLGLVAFGLMFYSGNTLFGLSRFSRDNKFIK